MSDTVRSILQGVFPALSIPTTGEAYRLVEATAPSGTPLNDLARIWPGIAVGDRVLVPSTTVQLTDAVAPVAPPASTTSDTFDGPAGAPNPATWGLVSGGAALDGAGHLAVPQTVNASVTLGVTPSFKDKRWQCELLPVPGSARPDRQAYIQIATLNAVDNYPQYAFVSQIAGILQSKSVVGSETLIGSNPPYNATNQRFLSLRETAGVLYAEFSADGVTWTEIGHIASPGWLAGPVKYSLAAGRWGGTDPGPALFDSCKLA